MAVTRVRTKNLKDGSDAGEDKGLKDGGDAGEDKRLKDGGRERGRGLPAEGGGRLRSSGESEKEEGLGRVRG